MGELFRDDRKYDEAIETFGKIEALPGARADWKCRAVERASDVLRSQKKYEDAVSRLEAAVGRAGYQPRHLSTLNWMLMRVCREGGMKVKAAVACRKVLALNANGHHVKEAKKALGELEGKTPE